MIDCKHFKIWATLIFLLTSVFTFAQEEQLGEGEEPLDLPVLAFPSKLKKMGAASLEYGDPYTAIRYYEKYTQLKPKNRKAWLQLGELYLRVRHYNKALSTYKIIYELFPKKHKEALFYIGTLQKNLGQYESADSTLKAFRKLSRGMKNSRTYRKLLKSELIGIDSVRVWTSNSKVKNEVVSHLENGINQPHIEFSPIPLSKTEFIYGSLKSDKIVYESLIDSTIEFPSRQFYVAEKKNDVWQHKGELNGPFNEDNKHIGNGALSLDGKRLYFTKCFRNDENKTICHLYYSEKEGNSWGEAIALNDLVNHPKYTTTQPTLGVESRKKQDVIYFSSDRPNGKGGFDIWYTEFDARKKVFKKPRNGGSRLNTPGDEITPFYDHSTGKLFFSSNGHPNVGGLDIFSAVGERSKWSEISNLGNGINSSYDDLDYSIGKDRQEGFFVSNREGSISVKHPGCCDDVFHYLNRKYISIEFSGFVYDKSIDGEPEDNELSHATVILEIINEDETSTYVSLNKTDSKGNYQLDLEQGLNYRLLYSKKGYVSEASNFSTEDIQKSGSVKFKNIGLDKLNQPILLKDIYYEFDKSNLTDKAKISIDTTLYPLLMSHPNIIVEIGSHTDSKGTDKYNKTLSQRRAESVVRYLIKKGIEKDRLQAKGYGESSPIAKNENADGTDNPAGRAKNRRTEFRIVGELEDGFYLDDVDSDSLGEIKKF